MRDAAGRVAHALQRAASRIVSTPLRLAGMLPATDIDTSVDTARKSACSTSRQQIHPATYWLAFLIAAFALPASAHVVSISSGELRVTGRTATYELLMPSYEVQQVGNVAAALLDQVRFEGAVRTSGECSLEEDNYLCHATYRFDAPVPDELPVECTLFAVTVPNHVHILYGVQESSAEGAEPGLGNGVDQVAFDQSEPRNTLVFRPPSATRQFVDDATTGVERLLLSLAGLLFLVTLAVAARTPEEGIRMIAAFLIAQWIARPLGALIPVGLSPTFLEAAMALTVAYLAAEVVFLPEGHSRWMFVPVLGLIHGLAYASFPAAYLVGASVVQLTILGALLIASLKLNPQAHRIAAAVLLLCGIGWFTRMLFA